MANFWSRVDDLAETGSASGLAQWLGRITFVFLFVMVLAAPHSIAATQTAWIIGMAAWMVWLVVTPRPALRFGAIDLALWAFFLWSVLTSILSYDPVTSIDKLRGTALFLIFYFVYHNIRNQRAGGLLAALLIGSCMINVLWVPIQRMIGRGVEIHGLSPQGPVAKALLKDGDTLLSVNGVKVNTPDDVVAAIGNTDIASVKFYRPDFEFKVDVRRSDLREGTVAEEKLGIGSWKKSRNWRSSGFYGHYTTYAEVLQLIGSLAAGLLAAAFFGIRRKREEHDVPANSTPSIRIRIPLALCVAAIGFALLLTVTRASQLAFFISAFVIALVAAGRRSALIVGAVMLPLAVGGLLFLQQSRQVGFFDPNDESIRWRQTVWREGYELWTQNARHLIVGVGMDSIKKYAPEWHLFDDGKLPMGHFHSTPLNLLVERGLPALILWLIILGVYSRSLWRGLRVGENDWISFGILTGCLGGAIGFFVSGLVHYNLGDQEVAMIFFLLMGLGMKLSELSRSRKASAN